MVSTILCYDIISGEYVVRYKQRFRARHHIDKFSIYFVLQFLEFRYCYACAAGVDPSTTPCEVCPFTGGAYKPTFKTGKWAHSLCCQWIPEIYVTQESKKSTPSLNLMNLDKKRYRLKCALCHSTKGAAVQCSFGRCTTSVHPWCALKNPQGFTRRVVVNPEGETLWEIFCKAHASAVSEPLKPKPKAKMSVPLLVDEPSQTSSYGNVSAKKDAKPPKERYSDISSYFPSHHSSYANFASARNTLTMAHAKNFFTSRLLALKDAPASQLSATSSAAQQDAYGEDDEVEVEEADSDEEYGFNRGQAKSSKQGGKQAPSKKSFPGRGAGAQCNGAAGTSAAGHKSFPILSMLEWPGISEGEPMDLDHFWNVVSGHFPEDHPKEVCAKQMCSCVSWLD